MNRAVHNCLLFLIKYIGRNRFRYRPRWRIKESFFFCLFIYWQNRWAQLGHRICVYTHPHLFFLVPSLLSFTGGKQTTVNNLLDARLRQTTRRKEWHGGQQIVSTRCCYFDFEIACLEEFSHRGRWDVLVFIISSWTQSDRYFALVSSSFSSKAIHSFSPWRSPLMTSLPFHTSSLSSRNW